MARTIAAWGLLAVLAFGSDAEAASQKLWDVCAGKDPEAAVKACTQILAGKETKANRVNAFLWRAEQSINRNDNDSAIADASAAMSLDSRSAVAFNDRGLAYRNKGDPDRALADLNRAIELNPKYAIAYCNRGLAYDAKGDHDRAIADYNRSIELNPKLSIVFTNRGVSFAAKGDHQRAIADLTRAIELDPNYPAAYANRGWSYYATADYDHTIEDLTRAIDLDPRDANSFNNRGAAFNAKGDYQRAIADLTRAIELDANFAYAYHHRAIAYSKTGKLDLARADITKSIELKPDYPEAKATLAELDQAEAAAKAAAAPPPTPSPPQQAAVEPAKPAVEATSQVPQTLISPAPLPPGKRLALVIGNAAYTHTQALTNPKNDAADIAAALERMGFTVMFEQDLTKQGMDEAFRRFAREVRGTDVALFYYAGHAMQFEGVNYLMPVDATLADEADVPYEMAKLDDVVADMSRMSGVRIAVLDACRNNPLEEQLKRSVASTRGVAPTRGLARIARPEGLIIAYATQPGNVAEDGSGRNSPFTAALLQNIETPGLEVGTLFRRVMGSVKQATSGKQHPELSVLFDGEFYFKPGS